jgi:hypothetical protein
MKPTLNMFDRIMLPVLALASLMVLVGSYVAGQAPLGALWGLAVVGFAYVLYQASRIGSPLLTAATAAVVMVGYLGPVIVHWRIANDYWRNYIWRPLGPYSFAAITVTVIEAAFFALPLGAGVFVAWIVQRMRKSRQEPQKRSGGDETGGPVVAGKSGSPPAMPTRENPAGPH